MPQYLFRRRDTKQLVELTFPAGRRPDSVRLTVAEGGRTKRVRADYDFAATVATTNTTLPAVYGEAGRGRRSMALGIMPKQIPEAMKLYPHHRYDNKTGDMIFTSEGHRRRCLKDLGAE